MNSLEDYEYEGSRGLYGLTGDGEYLKPTIGIERPAGWIEVNGKTVFSEKPILWVSEEPKSMWADPSQVIFVGEKMKKYEERWYTRTTRQDVIMAIRDKISDMEMHTLDNIWGDVKEAGVIFSLKSPLKNEEWEAIGMRPVAEGWSGIPYLKGEPLGISLDMERMGWESCIMVKSLEPGHANIEYEKETIYVEGILGIYQKRLYVSQIYKRGGKLSEGIIGSRFPEDIDSLKAAEAIPRFAARDTRRMNYHTVCYSKDGKLFVSIKAKTLRDGHNIYYSGKPCKVSTDPRETYYTEAEVESLGRAKPVGVYSLRDASIMKGEFIKIGAGVTRKISLSDADLLDVEKAFLGILPARITAGERGRLKAIRLAPKKTILGQIPETMAGHIKGITSENDALKKLLNLLPKGAQEIVKRISIDETLRKIYIDTVSGHPSEIDKPTPEWMIKKIDAHIKLEKNTGRLRYPNHVCVEASRDYYAECEVEGDYNWVQLFSLPFGGMLNGRFVSKADKPTLRSETPGIEKERWDSFVKAAKYIKGGATRERINLLERSVLHYRCSDVFSHAAIDGYIVKRLNPRDHSERVAKFFNVPVKCEKCANGRAKRDPCNELMPLSFICGHALGPRALDMACPVKTHGIIETLVRNDVFRDGLIADALMA